jgi:hypothetical protein
LPSLKDREKKVAGNKGASLIDIGDGVACLEFHTKMNAMGDDIINMVIKSADIVGRDFEDQPGWPWAEVVKSVWPQIVSASLLKPIWAWWKLALA